MCFVETLGHYRKAWERVVDDGLRSEAMTSDKQDSFVLTNSSPGVMSDLRVLMEKFKKGATLSCWIG